MQPGVVEHVPPDPPLRGQVDEVGMPFGAVEAHRPQPPLQVAPLIVDEPDALPQLSFRVKTGGDRNGAGDAHPEWQLHRPQCLGQLG